MHYEFSPWIICAVFSLTGSLLGAVFDLYRAFRYFSRPGRWLTVLGDIMYWVMVTGVLFELFTIVAHGELRFYFFLFLMIGLGIYYTWLSQILSRCYRAIGRWLIAVLSTISRLVEVVVGTILQPFVWLWKIVLVPWRWLCRPFIALGRAIGAWRQPPAPPVE